MGLSVTSGGGVMKTLFGAIVIMCFIWIVLVEIVACGTTTTTTTKGSFKRLDVIPRDHDHVVHHHLHSDPNFMSKRKVPNGPDPIHNRRAGKSGQPPGRV